MKPSAFRKSQPLALRAWHWADALIITGLLGTVLLRKTFLSWRTNTAYIEAELLAAGTPADPKVAKAIAVGLRDAMWEWHHVFGFVLAGLIVFRAIVAIGWPKEQPLASAVRAVRAYAAAAAAEKRAAAHFAIVRLSYVVFYACVVFMAVSGLTMYFAPTLGLTSDQSHSIQELHEWVMWFFVAFAAAHVLGVVVSEHREAPGIVSDMIQGGAPD